MDLGFKELKEEDQAELILLLGKTSRKRKRGDENVKPGNKALTTLEKKLRAQSEYLLSIRSALKEIPNKYIREMLEVNGYPTHGADIRLYDRCSDGIAFGRFNDPCSVCEGTYFSLEDTSYICRGDVSEYTKCTNLIKAPKRALWELTENVKKQSDYFSTLKLRTGTRLFNEAEPSSSSNSYSRKPLADYVFFSTLETIDLNGRPQPIKPVIESYGGKVHKKLTAKCTAAIMEEPLNELVTLSPLH
eukprot:sb/3468881/